MRRCIAVSLLVASMLPLLWSQGQDEHSVDSKIIALERAFKVLAYANKDTKTVSGIVDDSFLGIDERGALQTKADLLRFVQSADSLHYRADAMMVRLHGETAIVTGLYEIKGVMQGKPFQHRGRFVDTWMQKGGQWVAVACLSTPEP